MPPKAMVLHLKGEERLEEPEAFGGIARQLELGPRIQGIGVPFDGPLVDARDTPLCRRRGRGVLPTRAENIHRRAALGKKVGLIILRCLILYLGPLVFLQICHFGGLKPHKIKNANLERGGGARAKEVAVATQTAK